MGAGIPPWIKSDEIRLDTSQAPWMELAKAELGKNIREIPADDVFISSMRRALALDALEQASKRRLESLAEDSPLLGGAGATKSQVGRYRLFDKELRNPAPTALGRMEASLRHEQNPEITKYFEELKTDPVYDRKGRSFDIAPTYEARGYGHITAWCAAFVNWCLKKAGAPHLGYATAKSWLDFGTPIAHPVYGCLTIIKPSRSTGSTTGHVAFFVEAQGKNVKLLGGNQGDKVTESLFKATNVLGHRWPTKINHYLLARRGGVLT